MKCPSCGFENKADVKFCVNCGAQLHAVCPNCRTANAPGTRFCTNCGHPFVVTPSRLVPAPVTSPPPVVIVKQGAPGWGWALIASLVVILVAASIFFLNRSRRVPATQPVLQTPGIAACEDRFAFISDITIPDGTVLSPGESFTKTWRLRNTGTCTWTPAYQLAFRDGESMSALAAVSLPGDVSPGKEFDVSVGFVSPAEAGSYRSNWVLQNAEGVIVPLEGVGNNSVFVDIRVQAGDEGLVLFDDFDDQTSGWPIFGGEDENSEVGYRDGNYRFAFYRLCGFDAGWSPEQYTDAIVETVVSTPADVADVGAGFTLRATDTGWYLLWIYPAQGKYMFQKDIGPGEEITELVPLTESPVIRPLERGGRYYMQLKVETRGDQFDIWIGQPDLPYAFLDSVSDPELETGHLGPSADCPESGFSQPVEVLFEWIRISE